MRRIIRRPARLDLELKRPEMEIRGGVMTRERDAQVEIGALNANAQVDVELRIRRRVVDKHRHYML
jgi:hypothetical protein